MITTDFKKNGKGHDVFVNGHWVLWAIGSKKNAMSEIQVHLKKLERQNGV